MLLECFESVETVQPVPEVVFEVVGSKTVELDAVLPTKLIGLAADHVEIFVSDEAVIDRYPSFGALLGLKWGLYGNRLVFRCIVLS